MKKILLLYILFCGLGFVANAQDTLVTIQGKAYLAVVTKVEKNMIYYTRYPRMVGDEEMSLDVHSLREIRFYDGRYINYETILSDDFDGFSVRIDPIRLNTPSHYLKQSANCQFGVIGASVGVGFFGALAANASSGSSSLYDSRSILYVASIACGITALVCEIMSIVNLKKAGTSMARVHLIQNGISLDL